MNYQRILKYEYVKEFKYLSIIFLFTMFFAVKIKSIVLFVKLADFDIPKLNSPEFPHWRSSYFRMMHIPKKVNVYLFYEKYNFNFSRIFPFRWTNLSS